METDSTGKLQQQEASATASRSCRGPLPAGPAWLSLAAVGLRVYIGIRGYLWGLYRDNGKENGNYRDYIRFI